MKTYQIHINGIVQGVGFRPLVYKVAREMNVVGMVKNGSDGVNILINSSGSVAALFLRRILQAAPSQSNIISSELYSVPHRLFDDFSITVEQEHTCKKKVLISPDIATCSTCKLELFDKNDRRYRYPFITCAQCGPRYTIIRELPYERNETAMQKFTMCNTCSNEYNNVADRRFFSQTNSCAECGIKLSAYSDSLTICAGDNKHVLSEIKSFLELGKILAVKGIGGYLLICDANDPVAIQLLRIRKQRPKKPLALLYPRMETVEVSFEVDVKEKELLESTACPIVLLSPKKRACNEIAIKLIAPGLKRLGIMLPCSPLLALISGDFGKPLIATSANISGSPIIYKDNEVAGLFDIADYLISYDREIFIPEDDSVVQVSPLSKEQVFLRRSKGYAPSFTWYKPRTTKSVLCTGAHMKSTFTLSVNGNLFVSQFLGSGEMYESQKMYKDTLDHWLSLYAVIPEIILADRHPQYFSHQYAKEFSEKHSIQIECIQHHEAHFAAVLAENDLFNQGHPVLGVIWDGTGLGDDGNIWGGEFFKYDHHKISRCCHFDYFPLIAGDKSALEPRIAALCAAHAVSPKPDVLKEKFTPGEWFNYHALINSTGLYTSSVGRLFDAVASLLNISDKQTYEGEAAMYLQAMAEEYVMENGFGMAGSYFTEGFNFYRIPTSALIQAILLDLSEGKTNNYIAAKFHYSLVHVIDIVAKNMQVESICFSGGVFQNSLLIDWIKKEYSNKYQLHFHRNLSPNDENISFGQMVYYENIIAQKTSLPAKILQQTGQYITGNDEKNIHKINY